MPKNPTKESLFPFYRQWSWDSRWLVTFVGWQSSQTSGEIHFQAHAHFFPLCKAHEHLRSHLPGKNCSPQPGSYLWGGSRHCSRFPRVWFQSSTYRQPHSGSWSLQRTRERSRGFALCTLEKGNRSAYRLAPGTIEYAKHCHCSQNDGPAACRIPGHRSPVVSPLDNNFPVPDRVLLIMACLAQRPYSKKSPEGPPSKTGCQKQEGTTGQSHHGRAGVVWTRLGKRRKEWEVPHMQRAAQTHTYSRVPCS